MWVGFAEIESLPLSHQVMMSNMWRMDFKFSRGSEYCFFLEQVLEPRYKLLFVYMVMWLRNDQLNDGNR